MPRPARRWTSAEAAERLRCSVPDLLAEARRGGCGRKEGGRWTFGATDLRVYRRRMDWLPAPAPPRSAGGRLTRADLGALALLDRLLAEERALEQRYELPFRAPRQTATTIHQCQRCGQNLLFLIFADAARDAAGLLAYGRLMEAPIRCTNLPTYALAPLELMRPMEASTSLLMRIWPEVGAARAITPPEFEQLLVAWSAAHCGDGGEKP